MAEVWLWRNGAELCFVTRPSVSGPPGTRTTIVTRELARERGSSFSGPPTGPSDNTPPTKTMLAACIMIARGAFLKQIDATCVMFL